MIARTLLLTGLLATAAIAFSGTMADHTGVEITQSASANCIATDLDPLPECWAPHCDVSRAVSEATGEDVHCTM